MLSSPATGCASAATSPATTTPHTTARIIDCPSVAFANAIRPAPTARAIIAVAPTPIAMITSPMNHMKYDAPAIASASATPSPAASTVSVSPTSEFRNDSSSTGHDSATIAPIIVSPASRPDRNRPSSLSSAPRRRAGASGSGHVVSRGPETPSSVGSSDGAPARKSSSSWRRSVTHYLRPGVRNPSNNRPETIGADATSRTPPAQLNTPPPHPAT